MTTTALEQILRDAYDRFPGLELESRYQAFAYLEKFEEGIESFSSGQSANGAVEGHQSSAFDYRWLGVCYFKLFQDSEARSCFSKAIDNGCMPAQINLAHLLVFHNPAQARVELGKVDRSELTGTDLVLYHRVNSILYEAEGQLRDALGEVELAWKHVQGLPEFQLLASGVFSQMGVLYGRTGREQRALWFLDHAAQITDEVESEKTRLRRAYVLTALGRYQEARNELASLNPSSLTLSVEMMRLRGEIEWGTSNLDAAIHQFLSADRIAAENGSSANIFDRFICNLSLATIHGLTGNPDEAKKHLREAQKHTADKTDRLSYRFREIIIFAELGIYGPQHALAELSSLSEMFKDLGLMKEEGAVHVHIANLLHKRGESNADQINKLVSMTSTLQNSGFLVKEWVLLPKLAASISHNRESLGIGKQHQLEVQSIGRSLILFDGIEVQIPLTRAVELLCYFLEFKTASIQDVLADLFTDDEARVARNYFHQFRHQLKAQIDDVSIDYDEATKLYHLRSRASIEWDVASLRAGRATPESASQIFLPDSDAKWVDPLREEVTHLLEA